MRDKTDKLRMGQQLLGMQDNAYWASWIISALITLCGSVIWMIILGKYVYKFIVFTRTPAYVMFLLLYLPGVVYILMGCFFATVLWQRNQSFIANFGLILHSIVIAFCFMEPTAMKKIVYNLD